MNEIENRKSTEKISETKIWFFWKDKIDKPLIRITKKKERKEKLLISKMKGGASLQILWILKG